MAIGKDELATLKEILEEQEMGRASFLTLWESIASEMQLSYGDWRRGRHTDVNRPQRAPSFTVNDSTAREASEILADGASSYAFGQSVAWFDYEIKATKAGVDRGKAQGIVNKIQSKVYKWLSGSNFYDVARNFVKCGADLGSAFMVFSFDKESGGPVFTNVHLKDVLPIVSSDGYVNGYFRYIYLTRQEAIDFFGEERLPKSIREAKDEHMRRHLFIEMTAMAKDFSFTVPGQGDWFSVYWADEDGDEPIRQERKGEREFAFWRYSDQVFGGVWGADCPGMSSLPYQKALNMLQEDAITLSELSAKGLWKKTKGLKVNFRPGGVTEVEGNQNFAMTQPTGDLSWVTYWIDRFTQKINTNYKTDRFLILSSNIERTKTATEVEGISQERDNLLASFFFRLGKSFLSPLLEWMFRKVCIYGFEDGDVDGDEIAALEEMEVEVEYASPLFKAQAKSFELEPTLNWVSDMIQLMNVYPSLQDRVDFDSLAEVLHTVRKAKKEVLRPLAKAEDIRRQRAQAQAQEMQRQQQLENMDAAGKLASSGLLEAAGQGNGQSTMGGQS